MDQQRIGAFIKALRKENKMTQEQLAEYLNVSNRSVSRWENGYNLPDLDVLVTLADYFHVDIRELLDGKRRIVTMDNEQKETLIEVANYSKYKEVDLLRKVIAIVVVGVMAWAVSFIFLLWFLNSAKGGGILLISEVIALFVYGTGMLAAKSNRSISGLLNLLIGAAIAIVISNITLLLLFFGTGSYHNYGLAGVYYSSSSIFLIFGVTGIITSIITRKTDRPQ